MYVCMYIVPPQRRKCSLCQRNDVLDTYEDTYKDIRLKDIRSA